MPEVTVLTAVRDGAAHIAETIASIRAQSFDDWEYLVVDDASVDETPDVVVRFAEEDDRIRLVRRERSGGPFAAANEGLRHARGRYVVRSDADDVSVPTRIERQLAYLRDRPALRACGSYWQLLSASGEVYQAPRVLPEAPSVQKWRICVRGGPAHSTLCVEREALEEIGGYREEPVAQDVRLLCDLSRRDWLGIVPDVLLYYRHHPSQLRSTASDLQERLGDEIVFDHVTELLGRPPPRRDVADLHRLRHSGVSLLRGYRLLRMWAHWWADDPGLDDDDIAALRVVGADVRRNFARETIRRSFGVRRGHRVVERLRSR